MRVADFEKAIEALGVQGLEISEMKLTAGGGRQVSAVYGRKGQLTWLMWDASGRGFRYDTDPKQEDCVSSQGVEWLDYRRAAEFDLKFE